MQNLSLMSAFVVAYFATMIEGIRVSLLRLAESFSRFSLKRFVRCKRGSAAMVITLIVTVAILVIGVYILVTFQTSMPEITDTTANDTVNNIFTAAWNAYGLAVIIPIIIVSGAIIGYLIRGFTGGAR